MKNLKINLAKHVDDSYEIQFAENAWKALNIFLQKNNFQKALIVSDSNVFPLHYYNIFSEISSGINVKDLELQAGEKHKNMDWILSICQKLIEEKFNRNDCIIALWWGVIGDMVWFAWSIYKRWMNVIQIPTTLLSMFDSSVWWKTGVNFNNIKNIIGNFKQPKTVIIDSRFLETLPDSEMHNGYFEWLKHTLLDSSEYYELFKTTWEIFFDGKSFEDEKAQKSNEVLAKNISVKIYHVERDENEMWMRKFLNYGHTFGHAIELMVNFEISHGVCVGFGFIYENILSHKLWFLNAENLADINNFTKKKLSHECNNTWMKAWKISFEEVYEKMTRDKKNIDSDITFALLEKPWKMFIEKVSIKNKHLLKECFEDFIEFIK